MRRQRLSSISESNHVVSSDDNRVPISELEGKKMVGLYFASSSDESCIDFTPKLADVYNSLRDKGEDFEIVLVSLDDQREGFQGFFQSMPWLAFPFTGTSTSKHENLMRNFALANLPALVIIETDGSILEHNGSINFAEDIKQRGVEAYPFTRAEFAAPTQTEEEQQAWSFEWDPDKNNS